MTKEEISAFTLRITQSNRTELIAVLFEIYKAYQSEALNFLEEGNRKEAIKSLKKCSETVSHLQKALNFDYSLSKDLFALYDFVQRGLARSIYSLEDSGVREAALVMDSLQEAFQKIAKEDVSKPVMMNTQAVYAGITYGRKALNESILEGLQPRGFYA